MSKLPKSHFYFTLLYISVLWVGCIVLVCTIIASNAAQEKSAAGIEETSRNEESFRNDSALLNTATSTARSGNKRRPGRVVVKYKKVSVKPSSSTNSTSNQTTAEVDESVQGNKTRRMKPKSSPQTMIYKPSKNKLIFATSPLTIELMNEEPTTLKSFDVIEEEPSSTTTTTERVITTTKSRSYSPSTSASPAEQVDLQMVDSFIRPTARSRIRINKKPVVSKPTDSPALVVSESVVNRNVVRSRVRSTTTTTTQAPTTTTPKFIRPTRRPSGTRSSMFPNKDQHSQSIDESKAINQEENPLIKLEEIKLPIDDEPSVKIIEAFALPEEVPSVPVISSNNANQPTEDEHLDVEESIRNDETKAADDESVSSQPEQQKEKNVGRQRINVPRRKPTTPAPESSSEAPSFRRNPAAVREPTRIRPVVELKPDEELDEETQLRLQKYEMEKAKQLERLRHNNNNNRHNSQGTIHKTDDDKETPSAVHPTPPPGETGSDFTAQQTPQFSYGNKVPTVRERPNESPQLIRPEVKLKEVEKARVTSTPVYPAVPQRQPEVIYTPPLREFQPPASFHSQSAERTTQPIRLVYYSEPNEKEANILPPPVTYELPHADYQPPSPAPPPRIYVPPTEEYKPPTSGRNNLFIIILTVFYYQFVFFLLYYCYYYCTGLVIRRRPVESSPSGPRQRPAENVRMIKGLTDSYTRLVAVGKPAVGNNNNLPYPPGQVLTDNDHQLYIISTEPVQVVRQQSLASYTQEENSNNKNKAIKEDKPLYAQQYDQSSYREIENVKKTPKLVRVIKKPHRAHHALPAAAAVTIPSTTPPEIPIRSSAEKPLESYRLANYDSSFDRDQQSQSEPLYVSSYAKEPAPPKVLHYLQLQQVSDDQRYQPYVVSSERPLDEVIEYIERPLRENNEPIQDQAVERPPQGDLFSPPDPVIYHRPKPHQSTDDSGTINVELGESIGFIYDPRPEKVERARSPEQQFLQQRPRDQSLRQESSIIISNSDSLSNNRPYEGRAVESNRQTPPDFFQLPPPLKNPFESSEAVRASTEFIHPFSDDFWSVNPEPLIQYDQRQQQPPQQQQHQQYYQPPTTTPRFINRPKLQVAHTSDLLTYYQTPFAYPEEQQQRFNRSLEDDSPSTLFYQDYSRPEPDRSNRARQIAPARAVVPESTGSSTGRGVPGVDYPTLEYIPDDLRFSCESVGAPGYYADPDTRCQVTTEKYERLKLDF